MKKVLEPSIPAVLDCGDINMDFISHRIDAMKFENAVCEKDLSTLEFHGCIFRRITFSEEMRSCLFADCIFDHCDFSNIIASAMVARRTQFVNCRMTGTEFIRSTCEDMTIKGTHGMYANFSSSKMKHCLFTQSTFMEGAFSMCIWTNVTFEDCDLRKVEFLDTPLRKIDLTTCQIDGFLVHTKDLNGVVMREDQALACVSLLGIVVKN